MSASSSTSASEPIPGTGRRVPPGRALAYLGTALLSGLAATLLVSAVSWLCVSRGLIAWQVGALYRYQLAKLESPEPVDVALLGDSSLGNAVDARAWGAALDRRVVSLALTGRYGYEGTRNMLSRLLRRKRPAVVVIVQTLDMATRRPSDAGAVYTAERLADLADVPPWRALATLASLDLPGSALRALLDGGPDVGGLAPLDYVPQSAGRSKPFRAPPLRPDRLDPRDLAMLREIGATCRAAGVACLYAHGPYLEPGCSGSADYVRALDASIEAAGLHVVAGTPVCLPPEDAGDAEDHVAPGRKDRYSALYLGLVRAALVAEPPSRAGAESPGS